MLPVEAAAALVDDVKRRARSVLPTLDLSVVVEGQALQGISSSAFMPPPRATVVFATSTT